MEQKKNAKKRKSNLPPECLGQFRDREKARAAGLKGNEVKRKRMMIVELVREVLRAKPRLSPDVKSSLQALGLEELPPTNALMLIASGFNNAVKTGDMAQIRELVSMGGLHFNSSEEALEEKAQDTAIQQPTEIRIVVDEVKDGGATPQ